MGHKMPEKATAYLVKDGYQELQSEIDSLRLRQIAVIKSATKKCKHPIEDVRELPYKPRIYFGCNRPWLLCTKCGLTEEGWGCGYKALKHADHKDVAKITREEWESLRTKSVFQDGHVVFS